MSAALGFDRTRKPLDSAVRQRPYLILMLLAANACGGSRPDPEPPQSGTTGPDPTAAARDALVATLEARGGIADPRVLAAIGRVPRHRFVPHVPIELAYADRALALTHGQTISQPYVVALMTDAAEVEPGDRVLEVGTGSGYQAAVLAELGVELWSIEIVAALAERARAVLDELGHQAVRTRVGDGYRGWPEAAPFDAILVTAAPDHVPEPLLEQLAEGGRLVLPVGDEQQSLLRIRRGPDGFERETLLSVRFVPMTGEAERPR